VPKSSDQTDLWLTSDALREVHLALEVRIVLLRSADGRKLGPTDRAKLEERIQLCHEADNTVQKARGK
jgi:hypothetical protein